MPRGLCALRSIEQGTLLSSNRMLCLQVFPALRRRTLQRMWLCFCRQSPDQESTVNLFLVSHLFEKNKDRHRPPATSATCLPTVTPGETSAFNVKFVYTCNCFLKLRTCIYAFTRKREGNTHITNAQSGRSRREEQKQRPRTCT